MADPNAGETFHMESIGGTFKRWAQKRVDNYECTPRKTIGISGCSVIISIIIIVLVSESFSYVDWDEFALKQNTVSNTVYYDQVYGNGRYFWGLAYKPVLFSNIATTVVFTGDDALVIFSEGGLQLNISCSFQYKVIQEELPTLYRNYATTYPTQVVSIALSILKNIAPNFTVEDYFQIRDEIQIAMFSNLQAELHSEMNVNVTYFQLDYIELPPILISKLLTIAIQNQTNIKQQYVQEATVIRQQTVALAQIAIANATVINQTAIAEANFIQLQATANAFTIIQSAKKTGLRSIYQALNLNTSELQLAYLYTTQLAAAQNVQLLVDVSSVIIPTI